MEDMIDVSVILCAYNEGDVIEDSISKVDNVMAKSGWNYEIVVVDDGSLDHTKERALNCRRERNNDHLKVISHEQNAGKGAAIRTGFAHAEGKFIVAIDSDLDVDPYLIPNYGNTDRGPDSVVAEIGKDAVTLHEVQLAIQDRVRSGQMPTDMVPLYLPQIIDDLITYHALVYEAQQMGLQVSEQETSEVIRLSIPGLFPGGKFIGRDSYAAFVAQQNMTIPEFETDMMHRMLVLRLQRIVAEGTIVTPTEIEQEYRRRNDKIKIEYVKFTPDQFKSQVKVTPDEVKGYYDKNRAQFPVPEKRSYAILMLDQTRIEQTIQPTDGELHQLYESEKDKFRNPERVQARHILVKAASPQDDAKAKAKAKGRK
jgi:peptidyl-prolyl cis-trans isomerase D